MDKNKPIDHVNKNKTLVDKLRQQDWVKKLEAASGQPVPSGRLPQSSHGEATMAEQRMVQFRCAETGKLFFVFFVKQSPSHTFQVVSVSRERSAPSRVSQDHSLQNSSRTETSFDASDFDWTDWFCPYCGHKDTFVKCGQCQEVVCGGRVRELQDGTKSYACHDGCGSTGKIEGHIESYKGSREQTSRGSSSSFPQNPSQGRSLPLPKKHLPESGRKPELS